MRRTQMTCCTLCIVARSAIWSWCFGINVKYIHRRRMVRVVQINIAFQHMAAARVNSALFKWMWVQHGSLMQSFKELVLFINT